MRPIVHLGIATLLAASLVVAHTAAADDTAPPVAQPEPAQAKITKSRSNIQNNRAVPPAKDDTAATGNDEPAEVVKTKTKSNQSND